MRNDHHTEIWGLNNKIHILGNVSYNFMTHGKETYIFKVISKYQTIANILRTKKTRTNYRVI